MRNGKHISKAIMLITAVLASGTMVLADGMAFEPTEAPSALPSKNVTKVKAAPSAAENARAVNVQTTNAGAEVTLENQKFENALTELDAAQINIRNNLVELKTKYTEVDRNFQAVKAERKAMQKQVKNTEKKIKNIDKQKNLIRKNMQL